MSPKLLDGKFAEPMPYRWLTHYDFTKPSVFAALNPVTEASPEKEWVYVDGRDENVSSEDAASAHTYSGKCMIMGVKSDVIDRYFVECAKAVEAGEVVAAKAPAGGGEGGVGVLILYTKDFRCVLYTGPHTTASARWTPFLKDFRRRISPPRVPRFQSPTSTPFNSN